jgi:hypothetical protein
MGLDKVRVGYTPAGYQKYGELRGAAVAAFGKALDSQMMLAYARPKYPTELGLFVYVAETKASRPLIGTNQRPGISSKLPDGREVTYHDGVWEATPEGEIFTSGIRVWDWHLVQPLVQ